MYDIVGSLPPKLLTRVVEYLDPKDIIRNQRVSKLWRTIFSCGSIIRPLLCEALASLGLKQEDVSTTGTINSAIRYIRWRHGLEHVRPVKKIFLPWPAHLPFEPSIVRWHSRRLCYVTPGRGEVEMINFETGEKSTWAAGSTESVRIELSDRYLVTGRLEWGRFYDLTAYNLHTERKLNQRIPHVGFLDAIIEDKVVFRSQNGPFSVYVWDLSFNHVQQIGNFSNLVLYHVCSAENVLVAFEINWEEQPPEVRQTQWRTTTGQLLGEKTFRLPLPADRKMGQCISGLEHCFTYENRTVNLLFFETDIYTYASIHLEYDHAVDQLSVRWNRDEDAFDVISVKTFLTPDLIYLWCWGSGDLAIYNVTAGTVTLRAIHGLCSSSTRVLREWVRCGNILTVLTQWLHLSYWSFVTVRFFASPTRSALSSGSSIQVLCQTFRNWKES